LVIAADTESAARQMAIADHLLASVSGFAQMECQSRMIAA
jgi:hypothetical protein